MTTYYMNGCTSSNDDAITYFEERYFSVEKLVDLDNEFQQLLENCVTLEADSLEIEEEEHLQNIQMVSYRLDSLTKLSESLNKNMDSQPETDNSLDRAYRILIQKYSQVATNEYAELIHLLKQENPTEESDKQFNSIYRNASKKLNNQLDIFYSAAEEYGEENHIEIDWE